MIRKAMQTASFSCALALLSFGFAEPFDQPPETGQQKALAKEAPDAEMAGIRARAEADKREIAGKKESKTPVADLLNAAMNELTLNAPQPAAAKALAVKQQARGEQAVQKVAVKRAVAAPVKGGQGVAVFAPRVVINQAALKNDAFVKQMAQQYGVRMKQLQRSELHFMRQVCQPTKEQFEKVAAAGDAEMNATIKKLAKAIADQRMVNTNLSDVRKQITTGIMENVEKTLSPEQAANYQKEMEEREASRRRFVVTSLVWGIDKRLVLSAEQREKLTEVLMKNYRVGWNDIQLIMQRGQYFPSLPEDKINPLLTDTQKAIWRNVNRGTAFGNNELIWFQGVEIDAEVWVDWGAKK